jgi:hypothetical protein
MNQRLYFLFPDREHALRAVDELTHNGVSLEQMHALAGDGSASLEGLPRSSERQRADRARRLEYWGWRANLTLFFIAAAALCTLALMKVDWVWWMLPLALMAATLFLGERFSRMPNVHVDDFREALSHGEILLMVDVPPTRVQEVETRLHHHPEAVAGGSSWNLPALGT